MIEVGKCYTDYQGGTYIKVIALMPEGAFYCAVVERKILDDNNNVNVHDREYLLPRFRKAAYQDEVPLEEFEKLIKQAEGIDFSFEATMRREKERITREPYNNR
jgi:hypothetical protein